MAELCNSSQGRGLWGGRGRAMRRGRGRTVNKFIPFFKYKFIEPLYECPVAITADLTSPASIHRSSYMC